MLWRGGRQSTNIEDRRGMRVGTGLAGGGIGGIILLLLSLYFGVDLGPVTDSVNPSSPPASTAAADQDPETREFVATTLAFTEDTWSEIFSKAGETYRPPTLVLFTEAVESACGVAGSATGPFYCPGDEKVYLDTSFFDDLRSRFRAPGDFAQAYVIAHEIGHHVQNLMGTTSQVERVQRSGNERQGNQASVRLELQADCFAGVWARNTENAQASQTRQFLETGDVDEALQAASMIGDDRLQMQSQGYVVPESFTHGSSEQRSRWFKAGLESGSVNACNTFDTAP